MGRMTFLEVSVEVSDVPDKYLKMCENRIAAGAEYALWEIVAPRCNLSDVMPYEASHEELKDGTIVYTFSFEVL